MKGGAPDRALLSIDGKVSQAAASGYDSMQLETLTALAHSRLSLCVAQKGLCDREWKWTKYVCSPGAISDSEKTRAWLGEVMKFISNPGQLKIAAIQIHSLVNSTECLFEVLAPILNSKNSYPPELRGQAITLMQAELGSAKNRSLPRWSTAFELLDVDVSSPTYRLISENVLPKILQSPSPYRSEMYEFVLRAGRILLFSNLRPSPFLQYFDRNRSEILQGKEAERMSLLGLYCLARRLSGSAQDCINVIEQNAQTLRAQREQLDQERLASLVSLGQTAKAEEMLRSKKYVVEHPCADMTATLYWYAALSAQVYRLKNNLEASATCLKVFQRLNSDRLNQAVFNWEMAKYYRLKKDYDHATQSISSAREMIPTLYGSNGFFAMVVDLEELKNLAAQNKVDARFRELKSKLKIQIEGSELKLYKDVIPSLELLLVKRAAPLTSRENNPNGEILDLIQIRESLN